MLMRLKQRYLKMYVTNALMYLTNALRNRSSIRVTVPWFYALTST